jgi:hypothetical protein
LSPSSDAWANAAAVDLLTDLADRAIEVSIVSGRLHLVPGDALTGEDAAAIRQHRADLTILVLACDDRTLDRLAALQAGTLVPGVPVRGRCHTCGEVHEDGRRIGSCGWCRLAGVQLAHWRVADAVQRTGQVDPVLRQQADTADVAPCLLSLFPRSISGLTSSLFEEAVA